MQESRRLHLAAFYRSQLCDDCLPFWLKHAPNRTDGGYNTCLNRDGSVYDPDKLCLWSHGRIAWVFSYLYNELEPRAEWLDMARLGIDFLSRHAFGPGKTLYYGLTRDGQPLFAPRDIHVATSTILGFAEFARATHDTTRFQQAKSLFFETWKRLQSPGNSFEPCLPQTRPMRLHGAFMISLNVLQTLRAFDNDDTFNPYIDACINAMCTLFQRTDRRAILEAVDWEGNALPGWMGRWINPGHMIEAGIFLIHEGLHRQRNDWLILGADWINWGFDWGWDHAYGGIFNDVDLEGLPVPTVDGALRYASKLWWQHAEALYGLLLAYAVTGRNRFLKAHDLTLAYVKRHYLDPEHGEWFGILDRSGKRLHDAKGTERKSLFHLARNLFHAWQLCEKPLPRGEHCKRRTEP